MGVDEEQPPLMRRLFSLALYGEKTLSADRERPGWDLAGIVEDTFGWGSMNTFLDP